MIPRDVAELLDELWLITRRLDGPDRHDARGYIDSLRSALTRAFGGRVLEPMLECRNHEQADIIMDGDMPRCQYGCPPHNLKVRTPR